MNMASHHGDYLDSLKRTFREVLTSINDDSDILDLKKLEFIAKIRFVLAQACRMIDETEMETSPPQVNDGHSCLSVNEKRKFIQELTNLCEIDSFKWPRLVVTYVNF